METNSEPDKEPVEKWPGWPGFNVFRLIVSSQKLAALISKNGVFFKKFVDETRATFRVIDGPNDSHDRLILIFAKEEPEAALSPAMNAIIRIFKLVNGLVETDGNATASAAGIAPCSTRLLVPSTQALSLIGKGGCMIKFIQEVCGAKLRILPHVELPIYADADERIVELQGETIKVLKALEAVVGHLRKFLVDQSVLPLFEKNEQVLLQYNESATTQKRQEDTHPDDPETPAALSISSGDDCPTSMKKDSDFLGRESPIEPQIPSRPELYREDQRLSSSTIGVCIGPFVTQVAHTMDIPLACAEDIIGVRSANINYIRDTSGALITLQLSRVLPDKMTVEIKGTAQQVQTAKELIHEFIGGQTDHPLAGRDSDNFLNSDQILFFQTKNRHVF